MAKKQPAGEATPTTGATWVVGTFSLDAGPLADGQRFEAAGVLWATSDGLLLGVDAAEGATQPERLRAAFDKALAERIKGTKQTSPREIRTASNELLVALRDHVPAGLSLVEGETPEVTALAEALADHIARTNAPGPSAPVEVPAGEASPTAGFFRACAALYRAAPWKLLPSDQDILLFSAPALDIRQAAISIIGQAGESFGLVLFESVDAFEAYVSAAVGASGQAAKRGKDIEIDKLPAHLGLSFDGAGQVPADLRRLVRARGWEVASNDAFPTVLAIDEGARGRPTTVREQLVVEVVALAVTAFLADADAIRRAFRTDRMLEQSLTVTSSQGPIAVHLGAPVGGSSPDDEDDDDAPFEGVPTTGDEAIQLGETLLAAFAEAPEAGPFFDVGSIGSLVMLAWETLEKTPLSLTTDELATLLFERYARDIAAPPDVAPEIVSVLGAFFTWLARTRGDAAPHAAQSAALLDEEAARTLWQGLADRARWSDEKRAMMVGVPLAPLPPRAKPKGPLSQAEKNKQKAARKKR
jgi:hypothetical protein